MLTTFLTFFKTKILTTPVVFLAILVSILSLFLIYNSDTILTRLGFETKTNLKAQVVSLKKDLETAENVNKKLIDDLNSLEKQLKTNQETISNFYKEEKRIATKVSVIKEAKVIKEKQIEKNIEEKKIVDEENNTITLPLKEVNEHSFIQITTLNEVYNELFENI